MLLTNLRFQFLFGLLLFFAINLGAQCSYEAHFRLDGNPADSSIHQNHGTFFGGSIYAVHDRFNNANGALYFDGVDDYINTFTTYDLQERTVSFWFYATRTIGINALIAHDANNLSYGAFSANIENGDLRARAGGSPTYSIKMPIAAHNWHHLALVRRTDSVFFYLNGNFILKGPSNSNGSAFQAYNKLVIGAHRSRSQDFFKGRMDDLKIFNCAFDQSQIDSLFNDTTGIRISPCTQGYWPFEGNIRDTSGYGNHGTFHGAPQLTLDRNGNPNGAYEFDGVDDYIHTNTTYEFEQRTAMAWFKPYDVTSNRVVFIQDANTLTYGAFNASIHTDGSLRSRAGNTIGTIIYPNLVANEWYHVAIVRRPDSCFYYVNGVQTASSIASAGGSTFLANDKLVIGVGREENVKFFKGKIDEVKVIACDLNEFEIDSIYQTEVPNPLQGLPNDTSLCPGDSLLITMPSSLALNYLWDNGSTSNSRVINQAGTYWLQVSNASDTLIDSLIVDFLSLPIAKQIDTVICGPFSFTVDYSASTADSLLWSDGSSAVIRTFSGGVNLGLSLFGPCGTVNDSIKIQNFSPLTPSLLDTTLCPGDSMLIGDRNLSGYSFLWSTGSSQSQIIVNSPGVYWSQVMLPCDTITDTIIVRAGELPLPQNIDTSFCVPGAFSVDYRQATIDSVLWSDGDTSTLRTFTNSTNLSVILYSFCANVNDSLKVQAVSPLNGLVKDTSLCPGLSLRIGNRASSGNQFRWSTGATQNQIVVNSSGVYWSEVISSCDTVVDSFFVSSPSLLPNPLIADSLYLCEIGDSLLIGPALDSSISYQWSNNAASSSQWIRAGGTYTLNADNGCEMRSYEYNIVDLSILEPVPLLDTTLCQGQTIFRDLNQWPVSEIRVNGNQINNGAYQFVSSGVYKIEYDQPCGVWTDTFNLSYENCDCELVMANAFTPNGDGLNDRLAIKSACSNFDYDIEVFNRWGILVFRNNAVDDFWDGRFNGEQVPGGVFIYRITYRSEINGRSIEKFKQGTIRVYR